MPDETSASTLIGLTDQMPITEALHYVATRREDIERALDIELRAVVERARTEGMSWDKIGVVFGLNGETVRRRYAPAD